jgi:aldehyde dehydrogenase (NAD+)
MDFQHTIEAQKVFFNSNKTKEIRFRIDQLKKVRTLLKSNEKLLYEAIYDDFGKSSYETYLTELGLLYHEIKIQIKNIKRWSRKKRVSTGLVNFPAKSYIIPEPLGVTLVIGAWNYPYQLSLLPAVTALAAGNTVILKPSELPSHTSAIIAKLINENFADDYFHVIEGGVKETSEILKYPFDKIFFTGSIPVGKIVYQAASQNLTPVTLELGGKCPTFVMPDCNLKTTVRRIVWAKFLNAGQTCVAPDYILVHKSIEKQFLAALKSEIELQHPLHEDLSENYLQIINSKNFNRLVSLINKDKVCYGGQSDKNKRIIYPTVLCDVTFNDAIMDDEIFGPILPVISFAVLDEVIAKVKERSKPLSCYVFSGNKKTIKRLLHEISFGGGTVNDCIMHLSNSNLPFGGVGLSGIGNYHGKAGFDTFTHYKSIMNKPFWFEPSMKYLPYTKGKLHFIKCLLG